MVSITGNDKNWHVGQENVKFICGAKANPAAHRFTWIRSVSAARNLSDFWDGISWKTVLLDVHPIDVATQLLNGTLVILRVSFNLYDWMLKQTRIFLWWWLNTCFQKPHLSSEIDDHTFSMVSVDYRVPLRVELCSKMTGSDHANGKRFQPHLNMEQKVTDGRDTVIV